MKLYVKSESERLGLVAPRAGAWIETSTEGKIVTSERVAPRAGAWIETLGWRQ